ncbi:hypothetical protein HELRODRAFT_189410 [Helobdella robusta]|uniref:Uncharacterized protein n=1 Tax=Helobdella robusta TaxID=6412 RepID=T1FR13_HELRO|nr:hypothetical protein HELRODRAFT_189410 [Helobdella robusta]ESN94491.1 hypothetical protein HELRODRAFT_189410 [Helobdella robusta]
MNEQSDLLGTYSSPFGSKSISHLKTTKSGTGNGPDNLTTTTTTNSNTNKNKKPVDNNNKENEFDQLKMMNRFNALSGAVAPSPSCGGGHSSSSASDEKVGEYTLEAVELLDVENLLNNVKDPWLDFDLKSEVENDFDLSSWLNDGLKLEESNSKKPLNNQLGKSPQKTAFARQTSNLKNGLRPDPGTRSGISSKQSTCVGDVEDRCILPEQAIQHTLSNHNFYSSSTTSPEIKTNSRPEAYKQHKHGFLTFGDVKSEFGIRKYTEYSTKDETELNRTFDVISGHQEEVNHSQNNNDDSQQDNRGDPHTPSAPTHGSLLNKSFDDVISVVTSSGDFQSSPSGQKNISKSQDMASLWMGGMGRDSLTKLNDIKDVQNVARMQADRQGVESFKFLIELVGER